MRRRGIIAAAAAVCTAAASRRGVAQERMARIGLLRASPPQPRDFASFTSGLAELGHVVGRNIEIVVRHAGGDLSRLPALAREIAASSPALVVVDGSDAVRAMRQAAPTLPIIFTVVSDPVASGFAQSLARPGGNLTGLSTIARDLIGKRLSLLIEAVPTIRRIAILIQPGNSVPAQLAEFTAAAARLGLQEALIEATTPAEIEAAFDRLAGDPPDAIFTFTSALFFGERARIVARANALRRPQIYPEREFVEAGGLMSYGVDFEVLWRRAAYFVDRILKGAQPGDLPIEQPVKLLLTVNAKTARALGLTLPPAILLQADEVIE